MNCPKCGVAIDTTDLARSLASKGGKAGRGRAKARTETQARAAARVRWDKVKKPCQHQFMPMGEGYRVCLKCKLTEDDV